VDLFRSSAFVAINRIVGALGLIALPFFILHRWLAYSWCDRSFFLYKLPLFGALLDNGVLTISDFCLIELSCILALLFRVFYLSVACDAIIDTHAARMRKNGIMPKTGFIIGVIFGIAFFSVMFIELFFMSNNNVIEGAIAIKGASIFIPGILAFFYVMPEIILYFGLILFGQLDNR
jgi:hypothetical protein